MAHNNKIDSFIAKEKPNKRRIRANLVSECVKKISMSTNYASNAQTYTVLCTDTMVMA